MTCSMVAPVKFARFYFDRLKFNRFLKTDKTTKYRLQVKRQNKCIIELNMIKIW